MLRFMALAIGFSANASAEPPAILAVQGRLASAGGVAVDGVYDLKLALYPVPTGGTAVYSESYDGVDVASGVFSLTLGSQAVLPVAVVAGADALWLGVKVEGDPELSRQRLVSVAYALSAAVATTAAGLSCVGCVTEETLAPGAVGVAALAPSVIDDLVASKALAKVAVTGAFTDLSGGPDLSGYAALAAQNQFTALQHLQAGASFHAKEALLFRFQNATEDPLACTPGVTGLAYFNTPKLQLRVCNGATWIPFANAALLGSATNPAPSCKAIRDEVPAAPDGQYTLLVKGSTVLVDCDMTTAGGGWTVVTLALAHTTFGGQLTPLIPATVQQGIDAEHRPFTRDGSDDHATHYTFGVPFGYDEVLLAGFTAKANATPPDVSDLDPAGFVMSTWGTPASGCYGDIGLGSPDDAGPASSFAKEGAVFNCSACEIVWPGGSKIYKVAKGSTTFRIAWGEQCGESEGWFPWWAGSIRVR